MWCTLWVATVKTMHTCLLPALQLDQPMGTLASTECYHDLSVQHCNSYRHCMDWIEQGLTSPPTQYRLSGRQFYRSKDTTNSIKVLKEKLASHRPEEVPNPPGASHRVTSEPLKKEKPYHSGSSPGRQSPTQQKQRGTHF